MRNAGRVVSKTMILSHVWDYSFDPAPTSSTCWCTGCARRSTGISSPSCCRRSGEWAMSSQWTEGLGTRSRFVSGSGTPRLRRELGGGHRHLHPAGAGLRRYDASRSRHPVQYTSATRAAGPKRSSRSRRRGRRPSRSWSARLAPDPRSSFFPSLAGCDLFELATPPAANRLDDALDRRRRPCSRSRRSASPTAPSQVGRTTRRDELLAHFRGPAPRFAVHRSHRAGRRRPADGVGLGPLRTLDETVRASCGPAGWTPRRARGTGDAFDELSGLVNAMLGRIHSVITGMRGALDNVAHDLRTPLTRLRSVAEGALTEDPTVLRDGLAPASRKPTASAPR